MVSCQDHDHTACLCKRRTLGFLGRDFARAARDAGEKSRTTERAVSGSTVAIRSGESIGSRTCWPAWQAGSKSRRTRDSNGPRGFLRTSTGRCRRAPCSLDEPEEPGEVKLDRLEDAGPRLDERAGRRGIACDHRQDDVRARASWSARRSLTGRACSASPGRWWLGNSICRAWMFRRMETELLARWEPVLVGQDRLEAERLARSMPHACRALCLDEADPPKLAASGGALSGASRRSSTIWFERQRGARARMLGSS